jgi:hypothetical protein
MALSFPRIFAKQDEPAIYAVKPAPWQTTDLPAGPGRDQMEKILEIIPPLSLKFGPWLAGGAVRRIIQGKTIDDGDMDFFFTSIAEWQKFKDVLDDYECLHKSGAACTYLVHGIKVQIIKRMYYKNLDQLFGDFDFSACQVATDGKKLGYADQAVSDIQEQRLRLATVGRVTKKTVVGRMMKYLGHGFMPVDGLYSTVIDHGLKTTNSYDIFNGTIERPASNYDHEDKVEETIEGRMFKANSLRKAADNLGLELPNE